MWLTVQLWKGGARRDTGSVDGRDELKPGDPQRIWTKLLPRSGTARDSSVRLGIMRPPRPDAGLEGGTSFFSLRYVTKLP